ncbi:MAG TPA: anti-sigma factor [Thermoleophilaceae bacterium]|jgi:anti-sigma factor RsiW
MSVRDHERYRDDVGAYLLGALTDLELQAFERHLEGCADCREEIERLRPAAAALPRSVEPVAPPATLKASLMDVVQKEARERAGKKPRPSLRERLAGLVPSPSRMRPAVAWGSAAFVLAVGILLGFGWGQRSGDESQTLSAQVNKSVLPSATANLSFEDDGEHGGILRVHGLPAPSGDRVYQAWVQRDGMVLPQPTFEVGADGSGAVAVPDDLSGAQAVMVTREQRGGASAPSEKPILTVSL